MKFKKIISTTLACTLFLCTINTHAMNLELEKALQQDNIYAVTQIIEENPSSVLEYRDEQLAELKRILGEYVNVSQETIDYIHPLFLAITFETINDIFHKYPNITKAFMNMIKRRGGMNFSITAINQPKNETDKVLSFQYICADNPELRINIDTYGKDTCIADHISDLRTYQNNMVHPKVDSNIKSLVAGYVAHEIGHLIEYLVIFDENPCYLPTEDVFTMKKYKEYHSLTRIFNGDDKLRSDQAYQELLQKFPLHVASKLKSDASLATKRYSVYSSARAADIKSAISKGIPTKVSEHGETNSEEWFAEVFCAAWCHHNLKLAPVFKPEPIELLKYHMLEWLDSIEKMYAGL